MTFIEMWSSHHHFNPVYIFIEREREREIERFLDLILWRPSLSIHLYQANLLTWSHRPHQYNQNFHFGLEINTHIKLKYQVSCNAYRHDNFFWINQMISFWFQLQMQYTLYTYKYIHADILHLSQVNIYWTCPYLIHSI